MSQTESDTGASLHIIEMTSKTERRNVEQRHTGKCADDKWSEIYGLIIGQLVEG